MRDAKLRTLILGAGGFLGINLVDALLSEGVVPACGRRRRSNVLALRSRKVPLVLADLDAPETLDEAMRDVDVVFHLAGHYPRYSTSPAAAMELGLRQTRAVLDAAARAGVRRLIYASTTATVAPAPSGPSDESHVFPAVPRLGTYHDLKWAMEDLCLREDRLDVRVACPSGCLGPYDLRVGTTALLVALACGKNPPHPDGITNLVDVRDVATGLVRMARQDDAPRRVILSALSAPLHGLLCELAARYRVPQPSPPLRAEVAQQLALDEERRAERDGGRPALSREIADLVVYGVPLDTRLAEQALGMRWTPLSQTLDALDGWARRMGFIPDITPSETPA
ncbi:MAG: dihydroflavonol 4-reductase [Myxococcales bacterium]